MKIDFSEFENMIKDLFDPEFSFDSSVVESWSSMQSLIVVSAIDEHYDVLISHQELKKAKTIHQLHNILTNKLS